MTATESGARASLLALAIALAACGQTTTTTSETSATPPPAAPTAPQMPAMDQVSTQDFVQKAAMSDLFEMQAGELAQTRGNTAVKAFARQMVHDHRATTAGLQAALHGQTGLPAPPTALDQDHQNMLNDLRNANAAEFDQKYVDNQTHAHQDALTLMQNYARSGDNEALRMFASQTAPKVQHHLDMIRQMDRGGIDEPSRSGQ